LFCSTEDGNLRRKVSKESLLRRNVKLLSTTCDRVGCVTVSAAEEAYVRVFERSDNFWRVAALCGKHVADCAKLTMFIMKERNGICSVKRTQVICR